MIGRHADTVAGDHFMKQDDRPLATQTATRPPAPPRRPIVGVAMADDDDFTSRLTRSRDNSRCSATNATPCSSCMTPSVHAFARPRTSTLMPDSPDFNAMALRVLVDLDLLPVADEGDTGTTRQAMAT